jgi:hypothetical protein
MTSALRAALALVVAAAFLGSGASRADEPTRFAAVDVYVDAGDVTLAAWQVEIVYDRAACALAGVEGGERPFAREPYYDPKGLTAGRIVIADFAQGEEPRRGRIRVARLHLELRGEPKLTARLVAAASAGGGKTRAQVQLVPFERGGR